MLHYDFTSNSFYNELFPTYILNELKKTNVDVDTELRIAGTKFKEIWDKHVEKCEKWEKKSQLKNSFYEHYASRLNEIIKTVDGAINIYEEKVEYFRNVINDIAKGLNYYNSLNIMSCNELNNAFSALEKIVNIINSINYDNIIEELQFINNNIRNTPYTYIIMNSFIRKFNNPMFQYIII
jgi:hypothetical protein